MKKFFIIILAALSFGLSAQVTLVNVGSAPNMHDGDPLRTAFQKVNASLTYLESVGGGTGSGLLDTTGAPERFQIPVFDTPVKLLGTSTFTYKHGTLMLPVVTDTSVKITLTGAGRGIYASGSSTGRIFDKLVSGAGIGDYTYVTGTSAWGSYYNITGTSSYGIYQVMGANAAGGLYVDNSSTGFTGIYSRNKSGSIRGISSYSESGGGVPLTLWNYGTSATMEVYNSATQIFKIKGDSVFLLKYAGNSNVWLTLTSTGAIDTAHTVNAGFMLTLNPFPSIHDYMNDIQDGELGWYYISTKSKTINKNYGLKGLTQTEVINALMANIERSLIYVHQVSVKNEELEDRVRTLQKELIKTQSDPGPWSNVYRIKRSFCYRRRL